MNAASGPVAPNPPEALADRKTGSIWSSLAPRARGNTPTGKTNLPPLAKRAPSVRNRSLTTGQVQRVLDPYGSRDNWAASGTVLRLLVQRVLDPYGSRDTAGVHVHGVYIPVQRVLDPYGSRDSGAFRRVHAAAPLFKGCSTPTEVGTTSLVWQCEPYSGSKGARPLRKSGRDRWWTCPVCHTCSFKGCSTPTEVGTGSSPISADTGSSGSKGARPLRKSGPIMSPLSAALRYSSSKGARPLRKSGQFVELNAPPSRFEFKGCSTPTEVGTSSLIARPLPGSMVQRVLDPYGSRDLAQSPIPRMLAVFKGCSVPTETGTPRAPRFFKLALWKPAAACSPSRALGEELARLRAERDRLLMENSLLLAFEPCSSG
jgi:hypothetical protein